MNRPVSMQTELLVIWTSTLTYHMVMSCSKLLDLTFKLFYVCTKYFEIFSELLIIRVNMQSECFIVLFLLLQSHRQTGIRVRYPCKPWQIALYQPFIVVILTASVVKKLVRK